MISWPTIVCPVHLNLYLGHSSVDLPLHTSSPTLPNFISRFKRKISCAALRSFGSRTKSGSIDSTSSCTSTCTYSFKSSSYSHLYHKRTNPRRLRISNPFALTTSTDADSEMGFSYAFERPRKAPLPPIHALAERSHFSIDHKY